MSYDDIFRLAVRGHIDAILSGTPEVPEPSNICPIDGETMVYESTQGKDIMMRCQVCNHYKVVKA